jgi:hypothetical protein
MFTHITHKRLLVLLLIGISGSGLLGCGAQKFQTATAVGTTDQSSTSTAGKAAVNCSHDVDNLEDLSIRMRLFQDGSGTVRNDLVRIKFDRFPESFTNNDDAAIQVWTRTVDTNGNWGTYHKLSFYLEKYSSGGVMRTPYKYTDITWKGLKEIAATFGMSSSLTAPEFFGGVVLLVELNDTSGVSKVITVKTYDDKASSPETTALIPTFLANPREYAKSHSAALQALHPLQALYNTAYTEDQFQYEANQFCF